MQASSGQSQYKSLRIACGRRKASEQWQAQAGFAGGEPAYGPNLKQNTKRGILLFFLTRTARNKSPAAAGPASQAARARSADAAAPPTHVPSPSTKKLRAPTGWRQTHDRLGRTLLRSAARSRRLLQSMRPDSTRVDVFFRRHVSPKRTPHPRPGAVWLSLSLPATAAPAILSPLRLSAESALPPTDP